jgi:prepilin-type N-terminal cleavage/methylation domain-containing protein
MKVFKLRRLAGFTLTEIMIASTIGATMMGLAVMTTTNLYKDWSAANAYRDIHENARQSMAVLSRDIRSGVEVTSTNPTNLSLAVVGLTGTTNSVQYFLQPKSGDTNMNVLVRIENAGGSVVTNVLTDHATYVNFQYWANPGNLATTAEETFEVRAYLAITNTSTFRISSDLLQTRVLMRNKHY